MHVITRRGITREIAIHNADKLQEYGIFEVTPRRHVRGVQDMAWGRGPTAGKIYATSGLEDYDEHDARGFCGGYHRGFDVSRCEQILQLDESRAGEALAVDPSGTPPYLVPMYIASC